MEVNISRLPKQFKHCKHSGMGIKARPIAWEKDGECMICTSHAAGINGYPRTYRNGKSVTIARQILNRRLCSDSHGLVSRHTCDHRNCINPSHIISGTVGDNNRDTWARGRHRLTGWAESQKGENHRSAKLTASQVREIRRFIEDRTLSLRAIGRNYGVGLDAIRKIRDRKSWKTT